MKHSASWERLNPLLQLRLSAGYPNKPDVIRDVHFEVEPGEIVGLVGPSGEGKSTIALSILGLLDFHGGCARGEIQFRRRNLLALSQKEMRKLRGKEIALVPQSPLASLNPNLSLRAQLFEAWRAHATGDLDWKPLLESVSIPPTEEFIRQYPRNLSVGLGQRFLIALALLHRPQLIIADEPTSALDPITRAEILALFDAVSRRNGSALLYISHDIQSVLSICERVVILKNGVVLEDTPVENLFNSQIPYTRKLLASIE